MTTIFHCNRVLKTFSFRRKEDSCHVFSEFVEWDAALDDNQAAGTIASIARCDACIATVISFISPGGRRGGGVQNLYHGRFSTFLIQGVQQVMESVTRRVLEKFLSELSFGEEDVNPRIRHQMFETMVRVATVLVTQPSTGTTYVDVDSHWVTDNIPNSFGVIHDCCIAEISEEWETVQLVGDSM